MGRVGARWAIVVGAIALFGLTTGWSPRLDSETPVTQLATAAAEPRTAMPTSSTVPGRRPATLGERTEIAAPEATTTTTNAGNGTASTVVAAVVAAVVETAPPTSAVPEPPRPTDVGTEALALVQYDWRTRFGAWEIEFVGERDGLRALTFPRDRRIEVYVRPSDTAASVHRVLAHEIGHMIDVEINSEADRDRWRAQRSLDGSVSWWPSESEPDFATGAGDFAEAFAVLETGVTSHSTVAGQPTRADLELVRELAADR